MRFIKTNVSGQDVIIDIVYTTQHDVMIEVISSCIFDNTSVTRIVTAIIFPFLSPNK